MAIGEHVHQLPVGLTQPYDNVQIHFVGAVELPGQAGDLPVLVPFVWAPGPAAPVLDEQFFGGGVHAYTDNIGPGVLDIHQHVPVQQGGQGQGRNRHVGSLAAHHGSHLQQVAVGALVLHLRQADAPHLSPGIPLPDTLRHQAGGIEGPVHPDEAVLYGQARPLPR